MNSTEKIKLVDDTLDHIRAELALHYEKRSVNGKDVFFLDRKDLYFAPFGFVESFEFGIEYAQGIREAKRNWYEDGELFCPEDYASFDDFFQDILKEIED